MKNNPEADNKLMQSLLETLVRAGWIKKSSLVDSVVEKHGKVSAEFTKPGVEKMVGFKQVSDVFKDFNDMERQKIYALLEHWNSIKTGE